MRLIFVCPRYAPMARGPAPARARALAQRLAARGHSVEVLTSRALDPVTFEPILPAGLSEEGGVTVRRVASRGPEAPEVLSHLSGRAGTVDAVVFVDHDAWTTAHGLVHPPGPAVLLPATPLPLTARPNFAWGSLAAVLLDVPEEQALLPGDLAQRGAVTGYGVDDVGPPGPLPEALRGLRPYVLLEGPLEAEDGCAVVVEQFLRVQRGSGSGLSLALLGRGRIDLRESVHVRLLGDLPEGEARAARAGALAVLVPSPREALAHRALRAWEVARPVLADARSAVMRGVVERTGGGLAYRGSAELGAVLALLAREPALADALGGQGARALFVEHGWPGVLDRHERLLARVRGREVDAA